MRVPWLGAGRAEVSRVSFRGKAPDHGGLGEHGGSRDVVMKWPNASLAWWWLNAERRHRPGGAKGVR